MTPGLPRPAKHGATRRQMVQRGWEGRERGKGVWKGEEGRSGSERKGKGWRVGTERGGRTAKLGEKGEERRANKVMIISIRNGFSQ